MSVNTSRRLLAFPNDLPPENENLPAWNPDINAWQVRRHLTEESLLFVKVNVGGVTYFLDLDFRGRLNWINCKWKPKDKKGTWTNIIDKFKPSQLHVSQ